MANGESFSISTQNRSKQIHSNDSMQKNINPQFNFKFRLLTVEFVKKLVHLGGTNGLMKELVWKTAPIFVLSRVKRNKELNLLKKNFFVIGVWHQGHPDGARVLLPEGLQGQGQGAAPEARLLPRRRERKLHRLHRPHRADIQLLVTCHFTSF